MLPVVQAPDLNTDRRAVERGEFEASKIKSFRFIVNYRQARRRERDLKAEAVKALEMRQKQEEEMQEVKSFCTLYICSSCSSYIKSSLRDVSIQIAEQRRLAVHKARPMPQYKRFKVKA